MANKQMMLEQSQKSPRWVKSCLTALGVSCNLIFFAFWTCGCSACKMIATSERVLQFPGNTILRSTTLTELSAFGDLAFFVCLPLGDSACRMVILFKYENVTWLTGNAECSVTDAAENPAGCTTLLHHLEQRSHGS